MADVVSPIALDAVKLHLRINPGDQSEDSLLTDLITVAREFCEDYIGRELAVEFPKTIKQAMLLLIAHWYANREAVDTGAVVPREMPIAVRALLNLHKRRWF